jgi:hypothetical protein
MRGEMLRSRPASISCMRIILCSKLLMDLTGTHYSFLTITEPYKTKIRGSCCRTPLRRPSTRTRSNMSPVAYTIPALASFERYTIGLMDKMSGQSFGLAGTGKSTIARTVARNYFDKKSLGACCSAKRMPPKATTSRSASIISSPHF